MKNLFARLGFAATVFALVVLAQNAAKRPIFVSADQLDMSAILPSPPADGSPEAKAELAEVHRWQDTRSEALINHVKADDAEEDIFVFKDVLGEKFNGKDLPLTATLSAHVHNDEGIVVNPAKKYFHKLRPFNYDATVKPVCKVKADPADYGYPSGHGTTGYLEALVLVQIVPEKRDTILARAEDYAHSRVVCGVHYPSDTVASKSVAYAMMALMMNNPQFRKELAGARTETRHALGL